MKYFAIIILGIFIDSCSSNSINGNCSYKTSHSLKLVDSLSLSLDSLTAFSPFCVYLINENNSEYLIADNFKNKRIDVYNLENGLLESSVSLSLEGPNGIKTIPHGFYTHDLDSIYLFFNLRQSLTLINQRGQIVKNYGMVTKNDITTPEVQLQGYISPFKLGEEIHFGTYGFEYSNEKSGAILNLKTNQTKYPYDLPKIFSNGYWQGVLYDKHYTEINREERFIINSYGNDHKIYVVDQNDGLKKTFCLKSKYLPEEIEPYSLSDIDYFSNELQIYRHEALQGGYSTLMYDPYRKLYYRFVLKPKDPTQYSSPSQIWDNVSIILANSEFKFLGEFDLSEEHRFDISFVGPKGLYIFNEGKYHRNEDLAVFDIFNIVKLE